MADERYTIPFDELRLDQVELVGGKCANLGELTRAGFPVPPGFAVTTAAYERDDIDEAVGAAYAELGRRVGRADPPVAVRSSAIAEDMPDASFAGVQDTYLWICGLDAVLDGIRRCWASFYNPEAVAYRKEHGITRGGMSVAVQYMVDARVAGVMFTLNPVSGDRSSIAIDSSYGLGVSVVGGEVTPDSFLVSKVTREIVRRQIGAKATEVVADPGPRRRSRARCPRSGRRCRASATRRSCVSSRSVAASRPTTQVRRTSSGRSTASSTSCSCCRPGPRRSGAASHAHNP